MCVCVGVWVCVVCGCVQASVEFCLHHCPFSIVEREMLLSVLTAVPVQTLHASVRLQAAGKGVGLKTAVHDYKKS